MKFQDGGSISFTEQADSVEMRTRLQGNENVLGKCILINVTYDELDKLYGEIENILTAHEWDKMKAGHDE